MIVHLEGTLAAVLSDRAHLRLDNSVTYELLLPVFAVARLGGSIGQVVELHTLQFLESNNQGATFFPRLAGFLTAEDKAFFELFVSCKGIGHRKALRAMALPAAQLAAAIEDGDLATLQSLPEVGKRTAETIAATLRGKVERFLAAVPGSPAGERRFSGGVAVEAVEALVTLGERRTDAMRWVDAVTSGEDRPGDVQSIIAAVYRLKAR